MDDSEQGTSPLTRTPGQVESAGAQSAAPGAQPDAGGLTSETADAAGAKPAKPPRTRTSIAFQGFVFGAVVLALMLIFILENTEDVRINYLGAKGHLSLGVALLLAAVGGALFVAVIGAARISQLRLHARRQRRR